MVALIFLFLELGLPRMPRVSLSPQFETSQIGPGSTALEFVCSPLYWKNRPHVPFRSRFNIGRWSRVGDHFRHQIVSPGVRRERSPPTEQDAITMRIAFHI